MNVLKALEEVAAWTVGQVGFFCRQGAQWWPVVESVLVMPT